MPPKRRRTTNESSSSSSRRQRTTSESDDEQTPHQLARGGTGRRVTTATTPGIQGQSTNERTPAVFADVDVPVPPAIPIRRRSLGPALDRPDERPDL